MKKNVANMTNVKEIVLALADGNPGAVRVLAELSSKHGLITLSTVGMWLDEAGIYADDIWVGYKEHCGCNIDTFFECVSNADPAMLVPINEYREAYKKPPVKWAHC